MKKRSRKFTEGFYHPFLYRQKIPFGTHTYDIIHKKSNELEELIELKNWFPELNKEMKATENVIDLGYNNYILTLLEPHLSSVEEE